MMAAMTTEELFREDSALLHCEATVLALEPEGIVLDRTVFYPLGGGQAGDAGCAADWLTAGRHRRSPTPASSKAGRRARSTDRDRACAGRPGRPGPAGSPASEVTAAIDAERRRAHMRFHTATHLLCALVPHPVDGCSITAGYARLDFHMTEPLDKDTL
jgi:misacylated tRNA(Ala) deacylase